MRNLDIPTSRVLERIYATTALVTLMPQCKLPLLHPDHADALLLVMRDALAAVVALAPSGAIKLKGISYEAYTLDIRDDLDPGLCAETLVAALCSCTLGIIYGAAGLPAPELPSLLSLAPAPATARVKPFV